MLQQTHIKGAPKEIFFGVNIDGISIYRTSDKAVYEAYRFAELAGWVAMPKRLILKVWKDGSAERGQHDIMYLTDMAEDICMLLTDYALWRVRAATAAKLEETEPEPDLEPESEPEFEPEPQPQSSLGTSSRATATRMTDVCLDSDAGRFWDV